MLAEVATAVMKMPWRESLRNLRSVDGQLRVASRPSG